MKHLMILNESENYSAVNFAIYVKTRDTFLFRFFCDDKNERKKQKLRKLYSYCCEFLSSFKISNTLRLN